MEDLGGMLAEAAAARRQRERNFITAVIVTAVAAALGLLLIVRFIGAGRDPLAERASRWDGRSYVNSALGLRVDVPEGWEILENENGLLMAARDAGDHGSLTLSAERGGEPEEGAFYDYVRESAEASSEGTAFTIEKLDDRTLAGLTWRAYRVVFTEWEIEEYALIATWKDYRVALGAAGRLPDGAEALLERVTAA